MDPIVLGEFSYVLALDMLLRSVVNAIFVRVVGERGNPPNTLNCRYSFSRTVSFKSRLLKINSLLRPAGVKWDFAFIALFVLYYLGTYVVITEGD